MKFLFQAHHLGPGIRKFNSRILEIDMGLQTLKTTTKFTIYYNQGFIFKRGIPFYRKRVERTKIS